MSLYQFEAGELFYFVQDNICIDIGKMQHFWYYVLMVFFGIYMLLNVTNTSFWNETGELRVFG